MTGLLEACVRHDDGPLADVLFAPGKDGIAQAYWRRLQASPVDAGDAIDIRSEVWLVEDVASWRGSPGGVRLRLRRCNAAGTLTARTATVTGYGVHLSGGEPLAILGALNVLGTADPEGAVQTSAELVPVGSWSGRSGDLVVLADGSRWEQVGDVMDRASASWTPLPVIRLDRVRDGVD